ncbi:MAG: CHAT domain-containing protein [Cyanobacteria bacterium P01_G01_bin.39]
MQETKTEKTTRIPPTKYHNYPVDIYLRIYPQGKRYALEILGTPIPIRSSINMTSQDLAELNEQLQQAIDEIARNNQQEAPTEKELVNLSKVGHRAFVRVFSDSDARTAIKEFISSNPEVSIQVVSEDFFLPWELIYPTSLYKPFSCDHFWGMNYLISRTIIQDARSGAFVSPEISFNTCPKLGMLLYSGLPSVDKKEVPFFKQLDANGQLKLIQLRSLDPDPDKMETEFQEFGNFWRESFDLAHFACHAAYDSSSPNSSSILLSEEFQIPLSDMDTYEIKIDGHPLIIMNACETGNCNPLYTSNFATAFLKYGARGVVATECNVPDDFAADFAKKLYNHLLAGEPLGKSLLAARRYFWQNHKNPSGLLYSMYAPPSIRLVKAGGSNE